MNSLLLNENDLAMVQQPSTITILYRWSLSRIESLLDFWLLTWTWIVTFSLFDWNWSEWSYIQNPFPTSYIQLETGKLEKCSSSPETSSFLIFIHFSQLLISWYCCRDDGEGHCYTASLSISSLRMRDTGVYVLQLDNDFGGIMRTFNILVTEALISDAVSIWFFALFLVALILLVLNRFSNLGSKSIVSVWNHFSNIASKPRQSLRSFPNIYLLNIQQCWVQFLLWPCLDLPILSK